MIELLFYEVDFNYVEQERIKLDDRGVFTHDLDALVRTEIRFFGFQVLLATSHQFSYFHFYISPFFLTEKSLHDRHEVYCSYLVDSSATFPYIEANIVDALDAQLLE